MACKLIGKIHGYKTAHSISAPSHTIALMVPKDLLRGLNLLHKDGTVPFGESMIHRMWVFEEWNEPFGTCNAWVPMSTEDTMRHYKEIVNALQTNGKTASNL